MPEAYIYCRVSSERQFEGVSLDAQSEACRQFCQDKGYEIAGVFREVVSARNIEKQTELNEILDLDGPFHLVFYSTSRFSRNVEQGLNLARRLMEKNITIHSVSENIDISTAGGEYNFTSLLNAAELESKLLSQRIKDRFAYGKSLGNDYGKPPYGSSVVKDGGIRKFTKNEMERRVLKFVRLARTSGVEISKVSEALKKLAPDEPVLELDDGADVLIEGLTWTNISQLLNDYGIPYRDGSKWTKTRVCSLRKLLGNTD